MRRRGETIERSFAHLYDTGGMRRTHLRGHTNILKRVLIHAGGFNLGLVMRQLIGAGTPRGLQGRLAAIIATLLMFMSAAQRRFATDHGIASTLRGHWWSTHATDHVRRQLVSNSNFRHGLLSPSSANSGNTAAIVSRSNSYSKGWPRASPSSSRRPEGRGPMTVTNRLPRWTAENRQLIDRAKPAISAG